MTTLSILLLVGGCNRHVYSPPARIQALESAQRLERGRTAVQGEFGAHQAVFGPTLMGGAVRARHGLEEVELSAEASTLLVQPGESSAAGTDKRIFTGRLGAKIGGGNFAGDGGLGGGTSAGGPFVAPDVGFIAAYENCYFVPFGSARVTASLPVAARDVDVSTSDDAPNTVIHRPTTTGILTLGAGFKIPLSGEGACRRPALPPLSLLAGVQVSYLVDAEKSDGYGGGGLGVEARF
jgi:hypothetical protein